jgi:peptidoglycan/LPS O-acetylase OafA/YrhL
MINARSYRPEIDGLRAIAITAVILYHFFPTLMPGGFLGVDIFFVISGYLISKIIAGSLPNNKFNIVDFYVRRIKRIFPALLIVCSIFLVYGWFVLLPDEFRQMGRYVSYGSMFCANLALYRDVGYFDVAGAQKPLMHLWSLSVEEQFYLVWPLILWGFWKVFKNRWIISFIIFSILASYCLNIFLMGYKPNLAFYFPGSRMWELGAGALAAYLELFQKTGVEKVKNSYSNLLSFLGVVLMIGSLFLLKNTHPWFVYLSFLPIFGAFCFILNTKVTFTSKLLSLRPMVFIGLISYPMYLFHYPLISFLHVAQPSLLTDEVKIFLIILTIILSYLVYQFVEKPIRHKKSKREARILLCMMVVLGCAASFVRFQCIKPLVVYNFPEYLRVEEAMADWEGLSEEMIPFKVNGFDLYRFGNEKKIILFLGDSHMEQYRARVRQLYLDHKIFGKSAVFAHYGGMCPAPAVNRHSVPTNAHCMASFRQYALSDEVREIVIGASWIGYVGGGPDYYCTMNGKEYPLGTKSGCTCFYDSLEKMIREFISLGKKVYIMLPTPHGMKECDPASLIERNILGRWKFFPSKPASFQEWKNMSKNIKDILKEIGQRTGAHLINPEIDFCHGYHCRSARDDGTLIYKDSGHVRASHVRDHVKCLDFLFYA